jgi:hypothetical protein
MLIHSIFKIDTYSKKVYHLFLYFVENLIHYENKEIQHKDQLQMMNLLSLILNNNLFLDLYDVDLYNQL